MEEELNPSPSIPKSYLSEAGFKGQWRPMNRENPASSEFISAENREAVANALSRVLADGYVLYLKTHNYHWNVTGKLFHSLHEQFEEQYTELAEAIDEIAERIRDRVIPIYTAER